ncbi:MAG: SHOCT domain-containing protein [Micropepsaceae bacterium]
MDIGAIIGIAVVLGIVGGVAQLAITSAAKNAVDQKFSGVSDFTPDYKYLGEDGSTGLAIDMQRKKLCLVIGLTGSVRVYDHRDILEVEIVEDGVTISKTSRTSQAGNAILGGLVFGGVGAVVGALTSASRSYGKVRRLDLKIVINDPAAPVFLLNFLSAEAAAGGFTHSTFSKVAQEWAGRLKVLIKAADDEDQQQLASQAPTALIAASPSRLQELERLGRLREQGILTEDEFQLEKRKLMDS